MSNKKFSSVLAAVLGCSMLAAGTAGAASSGTGEAKPSDAQITQEVMHKLNREMPDSLVGLTVQTEGGVVTLSGRADTGLSKLKALQETRKVPGVTEVKDHLRITM